MVTADQRQKLGKRLRAWRQRNKLSQAEVARRVGLKGPSGQALISHVERGVYKSAPLLGEVAAMLDRDATIHSFFDARGVPAAPEGCSFEWRLGWLECSEREAK